MAHLHKKIKKGRPYYYVREIQRIGGKPKVVSQVYLGTAENIAKVFEQEETGSLPIKTSAQAFGALFIANELEQEFRTIELIDSIVPRVKRETGPSVGEYFFYAWANRLVAPKSKRALEEWYQKTAIQQLRPVELEELTSQRYWQKWDRVSAEDVDKIGEAFFQRVWQMRDISPEGVLFDTTNVFTYMASDTPSDLCRRGKNKDSKHHLRQVGLGLLVERETEIPLFYRIYPGNKHDSKFFHEVIDEMFGILCGFNKTKQKLTVVFDKGMNSEDNIGFIDNHMLIHFITTYSTYFVEELAGTDLKHFQVLDTAKNRELQHKGKGADRVLALRTTLELWGKERSVVITHNPRSYRKQALTLSNKLETVREALLEFRRYYREQRPHWRQPEAIRRRYERLCERLHIGSQYYQLEFGDPAEFSFRKNVYEFQKSHTLFGRNVIVTDNRDWSTEQIVETSLERYKIERGFRSGKDSDHVALRPFFHWTDSKIRCQLLTCVIALTLSRILEQRIKAAGINTEKNSSSAKSAIEEMHALQSVLYYLPDRRKAQRVIEAPTPFQTEVLKIFGWRIARGGVLQSLHG
jgi:transposase